MTLLVTIFGTASGVALLVHSIAHLILNLYPWHVVQIYPTAENGERYRHLNSGGGVLLRTVRSLALVLGLVSLIPLVASGGIGFYAMTGIVIALLTGRLTISIVVNFVNRRHLKQARIFFLPLTLGFNRLADSYMARLLLKYQRSSFDSHNAPYEDVKALISNSLRLLETSRISSLDSETRMIKGILRMDHARAKEIMQPLPDVVAVPIDATVDELVRLVKEAGHSKLPVYSGDLSNINSIKGILHARDLLAATIQGVKHPNGGKLNLETVIRPAVIVNEFQTLDTLLTTFQEKRTSIVLVVNEHGGLAGVVTVTDLLEEIVGELMDEFDTAPPELQKLSETEAFADGLVTLERIDEELGIDLGIEDVDTLGGYIFGSLGRVPREKDVVEIGAARLTVAKMIGRRVLRVRIEKLGT